MTPIFNSPNRRSQRLSRGLPVVVRGESPKQKPFEEEALTITFNAHGALVTLYEDVGLGQKLHLMNPTTWDEQEARVVYSTPSRDGSKYIGIEFIHPAPEFWPVKDPPEDWNVFESKAGIPMAMMRN